MVSIEERLTQLEVYADENRNDHEDRLKNVEDAIKEIPRGLIENWTEVKEKMKLWHTEEKDRKEAVRAV